MALIAFSCSSLDEAIIEKDISIAEVRELYNQMNARQSNGRETNDLSILWDDGKYKDVSNGKALLFPLNASTQKYVRIKGYDKKYSVENVAQAFAYKKDDGTLTLDYVETIPTKETQLFTGYVIVKDWNGDAKHVFEYADGLLISQAGNGRSEQNCVETIFEECTKVTVNGELQSYHCETVGVSVECSNTDSPPTLADDDFGNPEGGGSPGGSDTSLCPHPTIEGAYIECGTCGEEGFVRDANGNCVREEEIVNDFNNPCLKNLADDLISLGLSNELSTAIVDIFNENGGSINLVFLDAPGLGKLAATTYDVRRGKVHITVHANPYWLGSSAKEYVAAILVHELMHAYLYANRSNNRGTDFQHIAMALNYVDWMTDTLMEVFPKLDIKEANSLVLRTLKAVYLVEEDLFAEIIEDYDFKSNKELTDLTDGYRDGQKGSDCN